MRHTPTLHAAAEGCTGFSRGTATASGTATAVAKVGQRQCSLGAAAYQAPLAAWHCTLPGTTRCLALFVCPAHLSVCVCHFALWQCGIPTVTPHWLQAFADAGAKAGCKASECPASCMCVCSPSAITWPVACGRPAACRMLPICAAAGTATEAQLGSLRVGTRHSNLTPSFLSPTTSHPFTTIYPPPHTSPLSHPPTFPIAHRPDLHPHLHPPTPLLKAPPTHPPPYSRSHPPTHPPFPYSRRHPSTRSPTHLPPQTPPCPGTLQRPPRPQWPGSTPSQVSAELSPVLIRTGLGVEQ